MIGLEDVQGESQKIKKKTRGKVTTGKKEENVRADNGRRMEGNVRAGGYITGQ